MVRAFQFLNVKIEKKIRGYIQVFVKNYMNLYTGFLNNLIVLVSHGGSLSAALQ